MVIIIWMFNGAVSTKDIVKTLVKLGYKLDKYAVQKVHLVGRGLHWNWYHCLQRYYC